MELTNKYVLIYTTLEHKSLAKRNYGSVRMTPLMTTLS